MPRKSAMVCKMLSLKCRGILIADSDSSGLNRLIHEDRSCCFGPLSVGSLAQKMIAKMAFLPVIAYHMLSLKCRGILIADSDRSCLN